MSTGIAITNDEAMRDLIRQAYPIIMGANDIPQIARNNNMNFVADMIKKSTSRSGTRATWAVNTKLGTSAKHSFPTDEDAVSIEDHMRQAHVNWTHFGFDITWYFQELKMELKDSRALFDLMEQRTMAQLIGAIEHLEDRLWQAPANETDAQLYPMGIPYWVQKSATEGFYGGNPTGFTGGAGGISTTDIPDWANYTFTYSNFTHEDFGAAFTRAFRKMKYRSESIPAGSVAAVEPSSQMVWTTLDVKENLDTMFRKTNDNLGKEIITTEPVIRGMQVNWSNYLSDNATDNPIYMLDMKDFMMQHLEGDFFRSTDVQNSDRHNVFSKFFDLTYQYCCKNRRKQAVGYQV